MENTMTAVLCQERMHNHDERFSRDKERLDNHENRIKTTEEAVILLTSLQAKTTEEAKEAADRLRRLERRPGALWDRVIGAAISALVAGVIAYFF